jgi:hypothetical protein
VGGGGVGGAVARGRGSGGWVGGGVASCAHAGGWAGGGGGRIRLNATGLGECGEAASPDGTCTVGRLRLQLMF